MKKLRVTLNGVSYDVEVEILEDDDEGGAAYGYTMSALPPMPQAAVPVAAPSVGATPVAASKPAAPAPASNGGGSELTSPLAGVVHKVNVSVGDAVKENQPVIVIEAMKMNTNVSSPVTGKVKEIRVKAGDSVQQNQVLMVFE